jgi:hypothetical protein
MLPVVHACIPTYPEASRKPLRITQRDSHQDCCLHSSVHQLRANAQSNSLRSILQWSALLSKYPSRYGEWCKHLYHMSNGDFNRHLYNVMMTLKTSLSDTPQSPSTELGNVGGGCSSLSFERPHQIEGKRLPRACLHMATHATKHFIEDLCRWHQALHQSEHSHESLL